MTKTEIRRYWKERYRDGKERLVDIEIYDLAGEPHVALITISPNHVVWREIYRLLDNGLKYYDTQLLNRI